MSKAFSMALGIYIIEIRHDSMSHSQTFLESGMGCSGLIQGMKLLGIQVRRVVLLEMGRVRWGVAMILSTISIGSLGESLMPWRFR